MNKSGSFLMDVSVPGTGLAEITVDSGAEESVCPESWAPQFGLSRSSPELSFKGADGRPIRHFGTRDVLVESPS